MNRFIALLLLLLLTAQPAWAGTGRLAGLLDLGTLQEHWKCTGPTSEEIGPHHLHQYLSAPGRIRTCDLGIRSPSLSPLSYGGLRSPRGHEPWSPVPPPDTSSGVDRPFLPYVQTGDKNGLNVMCITSAGRPRLSARVKHRVSWAAAVCLRPVTSAPVRLRGGPFRPGVDAR